MVAAGALAFSVTWGATGALGVFLNDVVEEVGWSRATFSGAAALLVGEGMALGAFWGWLVDRWSARGVGLIAGGLFGAGLFLAGAATSPWQFYLTLGLLSGLGLGGMAPTCMAPTARWFARRRSLAMGLVTAGTGVGYMVMPQVAQLLLALGGWRFGLRALGVLTWAVIALSFRLFQEPRWFRESRAGGARPITSTSRPAGAALQPSESGFWDVTLRRAVGLLPYWVLGAMFFVVMINKEMVILHLVPSGRELGLEGATAASLATLFGGASIVAKVMAGYWADRVGPQRLFIAALGVQTLALVGLGWVPSAGLFFAAAALMGLTYGAWVPLIPSMAALAFGTRNIGTIYGSLMLISAVGAMGGPFLGGWLFDATDGYLAAYSVAAALALLAAALGLVFHRLAPRPALTSPATAAHGP